METIRNGGSFQGGKTAVGSEGTTGVTSLEGQVARATDVAQVCAGVLQNVWQCIGMGAHSLAMVLNPNAIGALLNTDLCRHSQLMGNQLEPVRCLVTRGARYERERWDKCK
jgi:hypothetical protein